MTSTKQIITRFPPSPTGMMHIGTARTALFNWLYARKHGGKMLFRIEDTDRKRHSEEAVEALINATKWLGLDWDGDIVSQYANKARHAEVANELLNKGKAWKCYFSQDELDKIRKENGGYTLPRKAELLAKYTPNEKTEFTVRIEAPTEGATTVKDEVQGEVTMQNSELDDFVILRSDGSPTYMLSVVVDDHDMGVTNVIRGDDHLNNTFRQNVIYDAMGWEKPVYAHVPLILGPDGAKMSKRHGAASVEEYRKMGYLPEAMRNYLLRLGWSHGDDEIISDAQAKEWFNLENIGKSAARFDFDKLENLNGHYINEAETDRLISEATEFYKENHDVVISEEAKQKIKACEDELKSRAKTLLQFADESAFFAKQIPLSFDEKAQNLLDDDGKEALKHLNERLKELEEFTAENIQGTVKSLSKEIRNGKMGKVAMPLRAALTGTTVSPSVFHVAEILGKEETCLRIQSVL